MYQTNENNAQNSFSVRTDLAIEARELAQQNAQAADQLEGVDVETKEDPDYFLTHVRIHSEEGSRLMGKPKGDYITLESEKLKENDVECHEKIIKLLAENIRSLVNFGEDDCILVAGATGTSLRMHWGRKLSPKSSLPAICRAHCRKKSKKRYALLPPSAPVSWASQVSKPAKF